MSELRPGPLGAADIIDRVEIRVTGQPDPARDEHGQIVGEFPPYDFTFRTDSDHWKHCAGIAGRALTQWTGGEVQMRRVRIETRTSEWSSVDLSALVED